MTLQSQGLILHQYDLSPFSEKARLLLGFKRLPWRACIHSTILPKPELLAVAGGYRQIPVLQIGADIFCGTELIADELDRRFPDPPLFGASGEGMGRALAAYWSDDAMFWLIVQVACASDFESLNDPAFIADRTAMLGTFDIPALKAALPANLLKLRAHLDLVERQLADGRLFLFGPRPDYADISLYHPIEFMSVCRNGLEHLTDEYPAIRGWLARVAAIGHGTRSEISRADALAVARGATPTRTPCSTIKEGPQPGARVRLKWWAYSPVDLEGALIETHPRRLAVLWSHPDVGEVIVHLPRSAGEILA